MTEPYFTTYPTRWRGTQTVPPKRKRKKPLLFVCGECGRNFYSLKASERAAFGDGCPTCGSTDIVEPSE